MNTAERIRVLIIDDDVLACEALRLSLEAGAFDVVGIEHRASISLPLIERLEPDVVLLDDDLPDLNGVAAYERIKSVRHNLPVMMMTANASPLEMANALAAGVSAVISKERLDLQLLPDMIHLLARGKDAVVDGSVVRATMAAAHDGNQRSRFTDGNVGADEPDALSRLELEVLQIAVHGYEEHEIAERLALEVETVIAGIESVCRKLQVEDRSSLTAMASRLGLTEDH